MVDGVDGVLDGEGHLRIGAVDRARGGINQVRHFAVAAELEDMAEADQVRLDGKRRGWSANSGRLPARRGG